MIKKRFITIIIFLLLTQMLIFGDSNLKEPLIEYKVNWESQQLEITVLNYLENIYKPLPTLKFSLESDIKQNFPYILLNGIELITIDSKTKGEDFLKKHPSIMSPIFGLSSKIIKNHSIFTNNLKILESEYRIDIYPHIAELFIQHTRATKLLPILDFTPSANFSGIVIYVDKKLPMYGKQNPGSFNPSLFPRVFDENLNIVIESLMVDPEIIRGTGAVGYQKLEESLNLERIGQNPLEIKARSIFGINNTDLIISTRDAVKILSRQNNLDLIQQGKIIIIYNNID